MKTNFITSVFASVLALSLYAQDFSGNPPSGDPPSGDPPSGEMPGDGGMGMGGVFAYDTVLDSPATNSDYSVSREEVIVGYASSATKCKPKSDITALVDGAYAGNTSIKTVNLKSSSITEIPAYCFAGCTSLKKVLLPKTVTKIGAGAFSGCESLVYAVGAGLTEIGDDAFRDCTSMTTAPVTNSATIGTCAFANCPQLVAFAESYEGDGSTLWTDDDEYDGSSARVYNGWILADDGSLAGTVQVKAAKLNSKTSTFTATATVVDASGKKWSYTKGVGDDEGEVTGLTCSAKNAEVSSFDVQLGANNLSGEWGDCTVTGARHGMSTKGDEMYTSLVETYKTSWTVAFTNDLGYTRLRLVVGNGGTTKITGTVATNLTASASVQSVMGESALYVPFVKTLKSGSNVHYANMLLQLNADGTVESLCSSFGELAAGGLTTDELGEVVYEDSEVSKGGESFSAFVSVDDLAYPVKFTAKGLPTGLKINASTGEIYGTPTKPGTYSVTVTVKSVLNSKSYDTIVLAINVANYTDDLIPVEDSYSGLRVGVKTYIELADVAEGCSVSGLPSGLKFVTKDTADKTYGFGTIPAYTVYGVPSKAVTNTVYFTKSVKETNDTGKVSTVKHTATATFNVDAIDEWAYGTFAGTVLDESTNVVGQVPSATISKAGKLSGKLLADGYTWKITSAAYDSYDSENAAYTATIVGKSGKLALTNEVTVCSEDVDGTVRGVMSDADGEWCAWQSLWKTDPWKTTAKSFSGKKLALYVDGDGNVTDEEPDESSGTLSLKFATSGAVTIAGKFAYTNLKTSKAATYSASCSTTLVPCGDDAYSVFVYIPAKTTSTMDFAGFAAEIPLVWDSDASAFVLDDVE